MVFVDTQYGEAGGRLLRLDMETGEVEVMPGFERSHDIYFVDVGPDRSSLCYTTMERDADIWSVPLEGSAHQFRGRPAIREAPRQAPEDRDRVGQAVRTLVAARDRGARRA